MFVLWPSGSLKYAFVLDRCHAAKSAGIIGGGGKKSVSSKNLLCYAESTLRKYYPCLYFIEFTLSR